MSNSMLKSMFKSLLFLKLMFYMILSYAEGSDPTKQKILELESRIHGLKSSVQRVQVQSEDLTKALSVTDELIGNTILTHQNIEKELTKLNLQIQEDQRKIENLQSKIDKHQLVLNKHLQWMFLMGPNQPLRGWFMAEDAQVIDRWLILYKYIVHARQDLMQQLRQEKLFLLSVQQKSAQQLSQKQGLLTHLKQNKKNLEEQKYKQQNLITQFNEQLKSKQQEIMHYEKSKLALEQLFEKLIAQKANQIHDYKRPMEEKSNFTHVFSNSPLIKNAHTILAKNHGLFFVSREGEPVKCMRSGRVVFSGWLKSYGLLLIVDHGQGWMSLYANNQVLYKHRGDTVQSGEVITAAGHTGGLALNGVYFEVRKDGRVMSAKNWLALKT